MKKDVIFCVDDEKIVLNSLKSELKNVFGRDYIIETAESGIEALETIDNLLKSNIEIPLIIADYAMPVMKGDELLIKINKKSPRTLKVLLTGQATIDGIKNSINNAGLFRYISKPWDINDLVLTVKQALKSYHQEDQLKIQNNKLIELSNSLEKKVELRTQELQSMNKLLLKKQKEVSIQNQELEEHRNHLEELVNSRTIELTLAKEKAEESEQLKSAFLANMSHEIRTPMNSILGFSEVLKNQNISSEQQQKFINIIFKSGERLLGTLNDLMDISKLETGQIKLNITKTNIKEEVENIYSLFKLEATNKGLFFNLFTPIENNKFCINTDREKLYGILSNLIKNAIKYTNVGGIDLDYSVKGDFLEFSVTDTGIGIPEDRQVAIFDRFVQADIEDVKAYEGCGLGLSIAKSYINMFNGNIWLESTEGKGSKFYFTIPIANFENDTPQENRILLNNTSEESPKFKILIAEDEEYAATLLSTILQDISSELLFAKNGEEAVEMYANNQNIDLILMDIKMPIMGGYEASSKIRELNSNVIIIAQTAYALVDGGEKAINAGFNDYVTKPIDKDILISIILKNLKVC